MVTRSPPPMSRLIDFTVRSGWITYWFRAGVPTSGVPSGESPTNEGMICSPPAASTWTLPSTSAATSEFVVPRSIPTITSAIRPSCRRGIAGDLDLGKTEHPAIGGVARAEHLEHGPRWRRGGGRHLHRPHHPRVERLAQAGDLVDVEPPQRVVEPVEREPVALDQRRQHGTLPEAGPEPAKPAEPAAGLLEPAREAITRLQQLG